MGSIGGGKVRVVARIKGPLNNDNDGVSDLVTKPWILVSRPDPGTSARVKISFGSDQITSGKQSYEVDECYEQAVRNEEIFTKEIKPLISGVFKGQNSTVFAYGPRGSGKTYTVQGSEEELGLAVLTMDSILLQAEEEQKVINVSVFEVCQDRIFDLLDSKRSEVSVFEDQGKIRLKGLSKVKVNSTEEFQRLYHNAANTRMQRSSELAHCSHLGCILHVVSPQNENSSAKLVGKINFIDLASYEDSRKKSGGLKLAETTSIKKSLIAVHNVLYALNSKDRVSYRESKLTRMLQDSLGGSSRILMVTCMNPSFCQETVQTISVASRSCIAGFLAHLNPSKNGRSSNRTSGMFSPQNMKSGSKLPTKTDLKSPKILKPVSASVSNKTPGIFSLQITKSASKLPIRKDLKSPKVLKPVNSSVSARKLTGSHFSVSVRKSCCGVKERRKLFVDDIQVKTPKPVKSCLKRKVTVELPTQQEETSLITACGDTDSQLPSEKDVMQFEFENFATTPGAYKTPITVCHAVEDKENKRHNGTSPPLSARLRELSNSLKSLCISTESNMKLTQESSALFDQVIHENLEPETEANMKLTQESSALFDQVIHENLEPETPFQPSAIAYQMQVANNASPLTALHGIKDPFVQESLKFLNTANKDELKVIKGIGEKRANYIMELRDESPEFFKELDDLEEIGLSKKQIKGFMKNVAEVLFT